MVFQRSWFQILGVIEKPEEKLEGRGVGFFFKIKMDSLAVCEYLLLEINKGLSLELGLEVFSNFNLFGTFCSFLTQRSYERTNIFA